MNNRPICPRCKRFMIGHADEERGVILWTCSLCHYTITQRVGEMLETSAQKFVFATGRPAK